MLATLMLRCLRLSSTVRSARIPAFGSMGTGAWIPRIEHPKFPFHGICRASVAGTKTIWTKEGAAVKMTVNGNACMHIHLKARASERQ